MFVTLFALLLIRSNLFLPRALISMQKPLQELITCLSLGGKNPLKLTEANQRYTSTYKGSQLYTRISVAIRVYLQRITFTLTILDLMLVCMYRYTYRDIYTYQLSAYTVAIAIHRSCLSFVIFSLCQQKESYRVKSDFDLG